VFYLAVTTMFIIPSLVFVYAVFDMAPAAAWQYAAIFSLSWVAGMLVFVVPAGLGVREAIFVVLARLGGMDVDIETLTAIAVAYRFWHILQELAGVVLGYILGQKNAGSSA